MQFTNGNIQKVPYPVHCLTSERSSGLPLCLGKGTLFMEQGEIWKDVHGFSFYQISNIGNVRTLRFHGGNNTKTIKSFPDKGGYIRCRFCVNGKMTTHKVHRLVANAFIPNPENKPCVNHKNGIRGDNRVDNLEWCTYSENTVHSYLSLKRKGSWFGIKRFRAAHNTAKKINQYDLNGNFIKEWDCIISASKELNIAANCISQACSGKIKTSGGFKWKYKPKI